MKRATLILLVSVAGCGPMYKYTSTSQPIAAKPELCDFQVTGSPPQSGGYQEIGVIEMDNGVTSSIAEFRKEVQTLVCKAGGDLVVSEINGVGSYVRGVVFRKAEAPAAAAQ
jgi:hypothetical protein